MSDKGLVKGGCRSVAKQWYPVLTPSHWVFYDSKKTTDAPSRTVSTTALSQVVIGVTHWVQW